MIITRHAKKRLKERLGLPKRAHARHIMKVAEKGMVHSKNGLAIVLMLYNDFLYIFRVDDTSSVKLITAYSIVNNWRYKRIER